MLFGGAGLFGIFLFLTYYLQATLGFSPVKTGIAFLPLTAALAAAAQVSNQMLLPRLGRKPIVPAGMLLCAAASSGLHSLGVHSSYASHVLPYLIVLGIGSGLSLARVQHSGRERYGVCPVGLRLHRRSSRGRAGASARRPGGAGVRTADPGGRRYLYEARRNPFRADTDCLSVTRVSAQQNPST
jgi:hypothetical protein